MELFCDIDMGRAISQKSLTNLIHNMSQEIRLFKLLPHLPGANALKWMFCWMFGDYNETP